MNKKDP